MSCRPQRFMLEARWRKLMWSCLKLGLLSSCAASVVDEASVLEEPLAIGALTASPPESDWWAAPCQSPPVPQPLAPGSKHCGSCICNVLDIDDFAQGTPGPVRISNSPAHEVSDDYTVYRHESCGESTQGTQIPLATLCRPSDDLTVNALKGIVTENRCVYVWLTHAAEGKWEPEPDPVICDDGKCCGPRQARCYKTMQARCL